MAKSGSDAPDTTAEARYPPADRGGEPVGAIASAALMNGRREVVILHAGERYRLRVTANDRLILTK